MREIKSMVKKMNLGWIKIAIAAILLFGSKSWAQVSSGTIDLSSESFREFEVFGDTLDNYSVYFTGENHVFATFNTEFQLKMLRYLHQEQNVRHFIFEQSPGLSYIINKIILEGKTTHMHYLRESFYDPFYGMMKELRKYNDTLPEEDQIMVHGIDIERFPAFSIYALDIMVDPLDKRIEGGEVFEQIKALASSDAMEGGPATFYSTPDDNFAFQFGQVSAWESLKSIIGNANKNKDSLKVALGKDSTLFYSIIESLEIGREWYVTEQNGDVKSPIIRERFMADEFERVYLQDMESKYYGQFGRCHLHKDQDAGRCYDYYMNSIANRINDIHPSLKNQVLVIPIFYTTFRDFDKDVIESLELDERYTNSSESYIIDLAYKNGDHSIVGFYNHLPFVIISNASKDESDEYVYDWDYSLVEYHLGMGIGYSYFNKMSKLNAVMTNLGNGSFDTRMLAYNFHVDMFEMYFQGASFNFTYYPEVSNGDRFNLRGYNASINSSFPVGGKFLMSALGVGLGYGKMTLVEELPTTPATNLITDDGKDVVVYKNDVFTLDPNFQVRITLPVISLNAKAGYAIDMSGKYWRLNGKAKDFTKTSFTSPYVQVGASLNLKVD